MNSNSTAANAGPAQVCVLYDQACADPSRGCDLETSCQMSVDADALKIKRISEPGGTRLCMLVSDPSGTRDVMGAKLDDPAMLCSLTAQGMEAVRPGDLVCATGEVPVMRDGLFVCMPHIAPQQSNAGNAPPPPTPAAIASRPVPSLKEFLEERRLAMEMSNAAAAEAAAEADADAAMRTASEEEKARREAQREAYLKKRQERVLEMERHAKALQLKEEQAVRGMKDASRLSHDEQLTLAQEMGRKPAMRPDMPSRDAVRYPPFGVATDSLDYRLQLTQHALATVASGSLV